MYREVDAGTVRTNALERMAAEGKIDFEDFRVISKKQHEIFPFLCSTVLYPEWPFASLAQTSDELAQKVKNALLRMPPDSPAAKSARCLGWTIPLSYRGRSMSA